MEPILQKVVPTDTTVSNTVPGMVLPLSATDVMVDNLKKRVAALEEKLSDAVIFRDYLQLAPYIPGPPVPGGPQALYDRACSADNVTIKQWFDIWLDHVAKNKKRFGDFEKMSVMQDYAASALQPVIVAGSGPSLKKNVKALAAERGNIKVVSCLHNFAFFEDNGVNADYYVNLDAGDVTISEMSQGGREPEPHYWERTKDRTLVTAITGHPDLINRWKGRVLFYNVIAPTPEYIHRLKEITKFNVTYSVGGNSLGACLYHAKAILGGCPIAYVGADFCFGYNKKFHSWDSPYDKQFSGLMKAVDIYGMPVWTWPSYFNFKCFFDFLACGGQGNQPGQYYNCTEGGILGAYNEGNIVQIKQESLAAFLWSYNLHKRIPELLSRDEANYQFLY